ncbi:MAG TPA: hypothetical protein PKM88_01320 [bacterium]|nr:hypothetical protein [bacterium]
MEAIPLHALDATAWEVIGSLSVALVLFAYVLLRAHEKMNAPEILAALQGTDTKSRRWRSIFKATVWFTYGIAGVTVFGLASTSPESIAVLLVILIYVAYKTVEKRGVRKAGRP